jgi:hypothetical protein
LTWQSSAHPTEPVHCPGEKFSSNTSACRAISKQQSPAALVFQIEGDRAFLFDTAAARLLEDN